MASKLRSLFGKESPSTALTPFTPIDDNVQMLQVSSHDGSNSNEYQPSHVVEDFSGLDESTSLPSYTDRRTSKILLKFDLRAIPMLAVLLQFSFMDKGNILNGQISGLTTTLELSNREYKAGLVLFFFGYAAWGVPSMVLLKRLRRPVNLLTATVVVWGVCLAGEGAVGNFVQFLIVRTILGACEAGIFPSIIYIASTIYCRWELQRRIACIYGITALFEPIMGVSALGSHKMDNLGDRQGWQWGTISLGAGLIAMGITLRWLLAADSVENAKFLRKAPADKELVKRRVQHDSGFPGGRVQMDDRFSVAVLTGILFDWKLWLATLTCQCCAVVMYFFSCASHSITAELGFGILDTQLLIIPPYVAGSIMCILLGFLSDKFRVRWIVVAASMVFPTVAFVVLLAVDAEGNKWVVYAMLFLIPMGAYPSFITTIVWTANNLAPSWRRALGIAIIVCIGNCGGAIGYSILIESEAPNYTVGYAVCLGASILAIAGSVALRFVYGGLNRAKDLRCGDETRVRMQCSEEQLLAMGDRSPLYRYVL